MEDILQIKRENNQKLFNRFTMSVSFCVILCYMILLVPAAVSPFHFGHCDTSPAMAQQRSAQIRCPQDILCPCIFPYFCHIHPLFFIHHLKDEKFQIIALISSPQNRMIRCLLPEFNLSQMLVHAGCCLTDYLCK